MDTEPDVPLDLSAAIDKLKGGVINAMGYQAAVPQAPLHPQNAGPPLAPNVGQLNKVIASAVSNPAFHPALNGPQQGEGGPAGGPRWEWWQIAPIDLYKVHSILRSYDNDLPGLQAAAVTASHPGLDASHPAGAPLPAAVGALQFDLTNPADHPRFIEMAFRMLKFRWADMVRDGLPQVPGHLGQPMYPALPQTWTRRGGSGLLNDGGGLYNEWRWQVKLVRLVDRVPRAPQPGLLTAAQMRRFLQSARRMFHDTWEMVQKDHPAPQNKRTDGMPTSALEAAYSGSAMTVFHSQDARNYNGLIHNPQWEFVARHYMAPVAHPPHQALPPNRPMVGFYYAARPDGAGVNIVPAGAPGAPPIGPIGNDLGGAAYVAAQLDGAAPPPPPAGPGGAPPPPAAPAGPGGHGAAGPAAPAVPAAPAAPGGHGAAGPAPLAGPAGPWTAPDFAHFIAEFAPHVVAAKKVPLVVFKNLAPADPNFHTERNKGAITLQGKFKIPFINKLAGEMSLLGFCSRDVQKPPPFAIGNVWQPGYTDAVIKDYFKLPNIQVLLASCPTHVPPALPTIANIVAVALAGKIKLPRVHEGDATPIDYLAPGNEGEAAAAGHVIAANIAWNDIKISIPDAAGNMLEFTGPAITDNLFELILLCSNHREDPATGQQRFTKYETAAATTEIINKVKDLAMTATPAAAAGHRFIVIDVGGDEWEAKKHLFRTVYQRPSAKFRKAKYEININAGNAGAPVWRERRDFMFAALPV